MKFENIQFFKIWSKYYFLIIFDVFSSQLHFKPITKTEKSKVRLLSNYSIINIGIENLKFNIADINDILNYIKQRYPNLLVEANDKFAQFENGDKIHFVGNSVLETIDRNVVIDEETNKLIDLSAKSRKINQKRFEFLFDFILNKIHEVNSEDNLTRSKKSIPYIAIYTTGQKIPLIIYLWHNYGLLSALNTCGINYTITEDRQKF